MKILYLLLFPIINFIFSCIPSQPEDIYTNGGLKLVLEISGRKIIISRNFTLEEANELVFLLKSGCLNYNLKLLEESVVLPTLAK